MKKGSRSTHCRRGHAFDEANTRIQQGNRVCRRCIADRSKAWYHAHGGHGRRDKQQTRENWRGYYWRNPAKHRDRNTAERVTLTDNYILTLIADQHKELRGHARSIPALINAHRAQLQLKRLIHERSK